VGIVGASDSPITPVTPVTSPDPDLKAVLKAVSEIRIPLTPRLMVSGIRELRICQCGLLMGRDASRERA
jgi:hypothetical protein